jgi:hypothetical protein
MNYSMTKPCDACPYLKGSGFTWASLVRHATGEFACHKTCDLSGEGCYKPKDKSLHCAGALIFLEKRGKPHQMMRIAERVGMYDRTKLDMEAPVVSSPREAAPPQGRGAQRCGMGSARKERRMTTWEYITMLDDCEHRESRMNEWEQRFCESLRKQLTDGRAPTPRQVDILDRLWERVTAKG